MHLTIRRRVWGISMEDFWVLWVWEFCGNSHGFFLWEWDGYGNWNSIPTAALLSTEDKFPRGGQLSTNRTTSTKDNFPRRTACHRGQPFHEPFPRTSIGPKSFKLTERKDNLSTDRTTFYGGQLSPERKTFHGGKVSPRKTTFHG